MKRRSFLCSSAALAGAGMLGWFDSRADHTRPHHVHAASLMTDCATRFLAALGSDGAAGDFRSRAGSGARSNGTLTHMDWVAIET